MIRDYIALGWRKETNIDTRALERQKQEPFLLSSPHQGALMQQIEPYEPSNRI